MSVFTTLEGNFFINPKFSYDRGNIFYFIQCRHLDDRFPAAWQKSRESESQCRDRGATGVITRPCRMSCCSKICVWRLFWSGLILLIQQTSPSFGKMPKSFELTDCPVTAVASAFHYIFTRGQRFGRSAQFDSSAPVTAQRDFHIIQRKGRKYWLRSVELGISKSGLGLGLGTGGINNSELAVRGLGPDSGWESGRNWQLGVSRTRRATRD